MVEEHWLVLLWPRKFEAFEDAILFGNPILERSFVESEGWEIAETGVHSILNLQSNWPDSKAD